MKDEKMTFQVINEKGEKIECEVLFTFDSDETKKSYIVYTDNTLAEDGSTKVYAVAPGTVAGISWKNSCGGTVLYVHHNLAPVRSL